MTTKLKTILGILVLLAGFTLVRLGLFIKQGADSEKTGRITSSQVKSATDKNTYNPLTSDTDRDGIPDHYEASYGTDPLNSDSDDDGYLDGEEVASGFDPLKKDKSRQAVQGLASNNNLTENIMDRMLAGFYAGDLMPGNDNFDSGINMVTFAAVDEILEELNPPAVQSSTILTSNSKEDQEKYLQDVSSVLNSRFLEQFVNQTFIMERAVRLIATRQDQKAVDEFEKLRVSATDAYLGLAAINVSPKWQGFHNKLLTTFKKLSSNYAALANINEDPVLALGALNTLPSHLAGLDTFLLAELRALIQSENLETPKTPLFSTINLLN